MAKVLMMKEIFKSFGSVSVLEGIDFSLEKGEVRALLGANGAGKSTLMKIVGGVYTPTSGEIFINGEKTNFKNEFESKTKGISVIYQELSLVPTLSVLENMFLGREDVKGGFLMKDAMKKEYEEICKDFDFDIDGNIIVSKLSIAKQQMVEIMKAVSCNADIIIMDEPTTSLTKNEKEGLFNIIHKLKKLDKSIIYISHILEEIFMVCDSASIMRNGIMVGSYKIGELTKGKITELMTGISKNGIKEKKDYIYADYKSIPLLELQHVSRNDVVKDVSFKVHKGEVVGLAGLVGSKRTEIIELIFGVNKITSGDVLLKGKKTKLRSPKEAIANKIGYIPEDRKHLGLILGQEVFKNVTAIQINKFKSFGFIDTKKEKEFTYDKVKQLGIKTSNVAQKIKELSGGNQQKVVVAKWLGQDLDLIIYDEPTKGIDIAAKEDIFNTIEEFSKHGIGVIFISSDLEEVIRVSDKIIVVRNGSIVCEMENKDITVQDIMNKVFDV